MQAIKPHWRHDLRLRIALSATVLFHGGLLASGSHHRTYDAYVHLFFADHYYRDWFSSWEPRWYTGFTVVSYPPGVHQTLAVLRGVLGTDGAYIATQLAALLLLIVGLYRFAALWVGERCAGWAALGLVVSSSLAEVVHVFGQLPTTFALALLLNAQPSIDRWLRHGQRADLAVALAFMAGTTAVHHVTTLFGSVFFVGPIVARVLLDGFAMPCADEPVGRVRSLTGQTLVPVIARRVRRFLPQVRRTIALGVALIATLLVVILPYWLWSSRDPIVQVSIPHGSRENFLTNLDAGLVFWVVPWASVLLLLPAALVRGSTKKVWPLAASTGLLLVLGTGGTTPIPRLLLGGAFDILTLDRFTIWASIMVLPLAAPIVDWMADSNRNIDLREALGRFAPQVCIAIIVLAALTSSLFAASLASFRPMQPDTVDPTPIVTFMEKDNHDQWRYLLLGFGDQMAAVSAASTARTVDGNYHSARRLPELTSRSVERLEGAKFRGVPGLGSLQQFVGNPERYNLKFIFSNDAFYDPLLWSYGWNRLGELDNDVVVWERADIAPLPLVQAMKEIPAWQRVMWGIVPPVALVAALIAFAAIAIGRDRSRASGDVSLNAGGRFERWLERQTQKLEDVARDGKRHPLLDVDFATLLPDPARQLRITAWLAGCVFVAAVGAVIATRSAPAPADAVTTYYEHLDFQEYDQAWDALDPATRVPLAQYLQDRSLRDGLFDGYAELDSIEVIATERGEDEALIDVRLDYLTSVRSFVVERSHRLVKHDGDWALVADPLPVRQTSAGMIAATVTNFSATTAVTDLDRPARAEDRPQLATGPATVVESNGAWSIVGEVTNIDGVPAQVTIEGALLDETGADIVTAAATDATMHVLLPGESTTYRIDFETANSGDFDPEAKGTALSVSDLNHRNVADVAVSVRAVRTTQRTLRAVAFDEVQVTANGVMTADLVNTGLETLTVPKVLVSTYDAAGSVVWVHAEFVPVALGPGARQGIVVDLLSAATTQRRAVDVAGATTDWSTSERFELEGVPGIAAVSLRGDGFERDGAP